MKEYQPKTTEASINIRYALMSMGTAATCAYVLFKSTAASVSTDKATVLIVLFNIIAVMLRPIVSIFADRVENKHTGVRLGTILTVLGYFFPVSFGISTRIVILALGSCVFHSFASSLVLSRGHGKSIGISLFLGGSVIGLAVYTFAPFLCHFLTLLLIICAVPDDTFEASQADYSLVNSRVNPVITISSALLLLISYSMVFYGFSSLSFDWAGFFKTDCLILASIGIGRALGGIVSDKLGRLFNVCAGAIGGSAIIVFCSDSKNLCLIGLMLLSMPLGSMITALSKHSIKNSGFIFALFSSFAYLGQELTFYAKMKTPTVLLLIATCSVLATACAEAPEVLRLIKNVKGVKNEAD